MEKNDYNTQYGVAVSSQGNKNMLVAYLFWWFLGWIGAHRFYLDRPRSAVGMIALFVVGAFTLFFGIGVVLLGAAAIWWLIDGYLVYKYVTDSNSGINAPSLGFNFQVSKNSGASPVSSASAPSQNQFTSKPQPLDAIAPASIAAVTAPQNVPPKNSNQCANCNTNVMKNMKYCPKCGTER